MPLARFDAGSRPLKDLLNATGTGFYVPLYQRPYRCEGDTSRGLKSGSHLSWTSDNASRLIADIVDGIARFQRTGRSSTFLGSLITVDDPCRPRAYGPHETRPANTILWCQVRGKLWWC